MRKFRFIGDPKEWDGDLEKNKIYYGVYKLGEKRDVFDAKYYFPQDWEEVFEEPKKLHKDTDLGYFAGLALQGLLVNLDWDYPADKIASKAINVTEELIKQLGEKA